ncbi:DUF971 domain-containing protein [Phytopseudomonas dryadis]|uniref:Gamma-butyrobetaine hydroxylase-like N-terminal domain-containing protein n=1 Tax=Phytopseudomonas dryadis TaxID=2487520 RepID=A0A4Q9QSP3_9GAMM|nr:gamma-butyrobetaine hydroxylase-like domain-containing protein [Pseudomonas dryadis]TBU84788.1 hypothetical protein DNK44_25005 [Pseudomonas dryadis]
MSQVPVALRNSAGQALLTIDWGEGQVQQLGHGRLRARCPCSQCRAARLAQRIDVAPAGVRITAIHSQGYGVQLVFEDGHDRGIYPWSYLRELGETGI